MRLGLNMLIFTHNLGNWLMDFPRNKRFQDESMSFKQGVSVLSWFLESDA